MHSFIMHWDVDWACIQHFWEHVVRRDWGVWYFILCCGNNNVNNNWDKGNWGRESLQCQVPGQSWSEFKQKYFVMKLPEKDSQNFYDLYFLWWELINARMSPACLMAFLQITSIICAQNCEINQCHMFGHNLFKHLILIFFL